MRFAVIGLDHRHVYELTAHLIEAGMECAGYWPVTSDLGVLEGFRKRFPHLAEIADKDRLLDDRTIDVIAIAAIPSERAALAIAAMRRGKDVLVDKPGITDFAQLAQVGRVVAETGGVFSAATFGGDIGVDLPTPESAHSPAFPESRDAELGYAGMGS